MLLSLIELLFSRRNKLIISFPPAETLVKEAYPFDRELDYNRLQFLIGTSANAVEWWPGPNDIRSWSWIQYAKYVSTSLDSFNSSISQLALQHYPPELKSFKTGGFMNKRRAQNFEPTTSKESTQAAGKLRKVSDQENLNEINQLNSENYAIKNRPKSSPESLYTRMVSDIKQTCPINVVSENLVKHHNATVFRYIATSEPSYPVSDQHRFAKRIQSSDFLYNSNKIFRV